MQAIAREKTLSALRARIAKVERWTPRKHTRELPLAKEGTPVLRLGALHEIRVADYREAPGALGFAMAILAGIAKTKTGDVVWLQLAHEARAEGCAYGYGLAAYGCGLERLAFIYPSTVKDFLWAAEEAVRAKGVAAVLMEIQKPHRLLDLTATRRLQLAAEASGATPILLRSSKEPEPTAAIARWLVRAGTSATDPYDRKASGAPRWRVELERCRQGGRGGWRLEWRYETQELVCAPAHSGDFAPLLANGSPEAGKAVA